VRRDMEKLMEMLQEMEESLGVWRDIIGGVALFATIYGVLLFFVVL
jgi:hypothetical protein